MSKLITEQWAAIISQLAEYKTQELYLIVRDHNKDLLKELCRAVLAPNEPLLDISTVFEPLTPAVLSETLIALDQEEYDASNARITNLVQEVVASYTKAKQSNKKNGAHRFTPVEQQFMELADTVKLSAKLQFLLEYFTELSRDAQYSNSMTLESILVDRLQEVPNEDCILHLPKHRSYNFFGSNKPSSRANYAERFITQVTSIIPVLICFESTLSIENDKSDAHLVNSKKP